MGHHTVSTHYRTIAYPYAGQHRRIDAYPHLFLNDNRATIRGTLVIEIRVVIDGNEIYFRSDEHTIAYGNAATVEECAASSLRRTIHFRGDRLLILPKSRLKEARLRPV